MSIVMVVFSSLAGLIWLARVRRRIRSYSFWSYSFEVTDSLEMSVGRIASWASWADADFVLNLRTVEYSGPYRRLINSVAAAIAWPLRLTESVRM